MVSARLKRLEYTAQAAGGAFGFDDADFAPVTWQGVFWRRVSMLVLGSGALCFLVYGAVFERLIG